MRAVGLFRELSHNMPSSAASMHEAAGKISDDIANAVGSYLENGIPIFDIMETTIDPIDRTTKIPGGSSLLSDGHWVWREDLSYFVKKYKLQLPQSFIEHALYRQGSTLDKDAIIHNWQIAVETYEAAESKST